MAKKYYIDKNVIELIKHVVLILRKKGNNSDLKKYAKYINQDLKMCQFCNRETIHTLQIEGNICIFCEQKNDNPQIKLF